VEDVEGPGSQRHHGHQPRNADYVLKYNKRHLYPIVDDKIITKERAIQAGIHVPEMYGIISTEKEIEKFDEIVGRRNDFVIKPAQGAGGDGIIVIADRSRPLQVGFRQDHQPRRDRAATLEHPLRPVLPWAATATAD
jgi:Pyruvate carboxylase